MNIQYQMQKNNQVLVLSILSINNIGWCSTPVSCNMLKLLRTAGEYFSLILRTMLLLVELALCTDGRNPPYSCVFKAGARHHILSKQSLQPRFNCKVTRTNSACYTCSIHVIAQSLNYHNNVLYTTAVWCLLCVIVSYQECPSEGIN